MTRRLPRTLLLAVAAFACGPKTPDGAAEETSDSDAASTSGPGPTSTVDPTAPTQGSQAATDDDDPTSASSVTVTATTPTTVTVTDPSDSDPTVPPDPDTTDTEGTTAPPDPSDGDSDLCMRAGGVSGVGELVTGFLTNVLLDDRINAYFLRNDLDFQNLGDCVVDQLGEAMGCAGVVYGCKTMLAAHQGLGISTQDFTDFAEDFATAWDAHKAAHPELTDDDFNDVIGLLGALAPDIVEDIDSNLTVYQRVGRKPALQALVGHPDESGSFVDNVNKDPAISGFFAATDFERLNTCLHRQLTSLDGPNIYGLERDDNPPDIDPGASQAAPCRDMVTTHVDLIDTNDAIGIEFADFLALVMDLVTAMDSAGVSMDDQNLILGALGPLCSSIVTVDPDQCP